MQNSNRTPSRMSRRAWTTCLRESLLAAPMLRPRRLRQPGVLTRRKILAAATSGIVGVILGERLLAPLRAEAQPRGLLPWLSGGGSVAAPETGARSGAALAAELRPPLWISTRSSCRVSGHWAIISG